MLSLKSNAEIDKQSNLEINEKTEVAPEWVTTGLAGHIRKQWEKAKNLKTPIDVRNKKAERARNGQYDPEKIAAIRSANSSEIFINLTATKCRTAEAWIADMERALDDRLWSLVPTPVPELPPDVEKSIVEKLSQQLVPMAFQQAQVTGQQPNVMELSQQIQQQAESIKQKVRDELVKDSNDRAEKMSKTIETQLIDGNFYKALKETTADVVTYCAGILKGPIYRRRQKEDWKQLGGKWYAVVEERIVPEFERTSPHDFFPLGNTLNDDLIERRPMTRQDLNDMIGVDGSNDTEIMEALVRFSDKGFKEWTGIDGNRDKIADPKNHALGYDDSLIDALQYWGSIPSKLLREWGNKECKESDDHKQVNVECWLIGNSVIKAIINPHPSGKKPYRVTSFEKQPDSLWGRGIPEVIMDIQAMCNAAARAMINNMAMSSQPQVEVNVDRIAAGTDIQKLWSGRIWASTTKQMQEGAAVKFFQPQTIVNELLALYNHFSKLADENSNIPAFAHGDGNVGGGGNTASGLSMLRTDSAKGVNMVYTNRDVDIIDPCVYEMYRYNMRYSDDESIKGDLKAIVKGADSIIAKEQQISRINEFLIATNNPTDIQIIQLSGRARLLRRTIKNLGIDDVNDIIPEFKANVPTMGMSQAQVGQNGPLPGQPGMPGMANPGTLPGQPDQLPGGMVAGGQDQAGFRQQQITKGA